MSKKTMVLEYMKQNNGITSLESIKLFGATRLSAIIYDLKDDYEIRSCFVRVNDRFGKEVNVKRYFLMGKKKKSSFLDLIRRFM